MQKIIIALSYFAGYSAVSPLLASMTPQEFTFTATGSYTPGAAVTYTETVTSVSGSPYASIQEGSSPCFLPVGCDLGDFTLSFGKISLPSNFNLISAHIALDFGAQLMTAGDIYQPISVTPIDSGKPFTAGGSGSHYQLFTPTCDCYALGLGIPGYSNIGGDFTSETAAALSGNGDLAPITGNWNLRFGFKTAQSAYPGVNAVTVFQELFNLPAMNPTATLVITAIDPPSPASVPEPRSNWLLAAGLIGLRIWRGHR